MKKYVYSFILDFCKSLAGKGDAYASESDDDTEEGSEKSEEDDGPFINHPFKVSESKPNIVMNIRVSYIFFT